MGVRKAEVYLLQCLVRDPPLLLHLLPSLREVDIFHFKAFPEMLAYFSIEFEVQILLL
jgi:hypothetical protein